MSRTVLARKSVLTSIRLDAEIKENLKQESDKTGATLNGLISQILSRYATWEIFARESDFEFFPRQLLAALIDRIDDDALVKVAGTVGQKSLRDIMIYSKGEVTLDNLLATLGKWLEPSNFQYKRMENDSLKLIIRHSYGRKWSVFLLGLTDPFMNQLGFKKVDALIENDLFVYIGAKV